MRSERGKVARRMSERLEIHRKRYSEGIVLFLLGLAMAVGIVVLVRVPASGFGSLISGVQDAGDASLVGGLLKTLLAMSLIGLLLLAYWSLKSMLSAIPEMVIDTRGILLRVGGKERMLAWTDIVGLRIDTTRGRRSLHVIPAPEMIHGKGKDGPQGQMEITITKGTINASFQHVVDVTKRVAPSHLAAQL
tara:strand:+ start:970 stop:1542 length:573 start_codon:yes stop_codon:yes gene_type:complete